MALTEAAGGYNEQLGFLNELFVLFDLRDMVYQGNGLILDGHDIGENLQRDTEFLLSQLRGIENKRIQYIPRHAQNPQLITTLQQQFNLSYSIILGFIAAGAQELALRDELKQLNAKLCSTYLHGRIMSFAEMNVFTSTEKGKPVRLATRMA